MLILRNTLRHEGCSSGKGKETAANLPPFTNRSKAQPPSSPRAFLPGPLPCSSLLLPSYHPQACSADAAGREMPPGMTKNLLRTSHGRYSVDTVSVLSSHTSRPRQSVTFFPFCGGLKEKRDPSEVATESQRWTPKSTPPSPENQ